MNFPRKRLFYVTILSTLFTLGCFNPFNPNVRNSQNQDADFSTPYLTLRNLEDAYNRKDITLFEKCLSDDFMFQMLSSDVDEIGIDFNNDGINDNWWGYEQEVSVHENLFELGSSDGNRKPPDNITLNLIIPDESSWQEDTQDGHEGWIIIPCDFFLNLSFFSGLNISSSGSATFFLEQNIQGDWLIAIWRDRSNI